MAGRHVDPTRFLGIGALVDWSAVAAAELEAGVEVEPAEDIAARRGLGGSASFQLRWVFDAGLGYPSTPFTVWTRTPHLDIPTVDWVESDAPGTTLLLYEAYAEVVVDLADGPGGMATGYQGMPLASVVQAMVAVAPGAATVRLTGPEIRVVVLPVGSTVSSVRARPDVADDDAWEPIEIVGLPGDGRPAAATDLTSPQGLVNALTDPVSAAYDRFNRGAPFYGWPGFIRTGVPAPAWQLAEPKPMVHLFHREMLDDFITMVDAGPSNQQEAMKFHRTITTPTGSPATVEFNPLRMLLYGAATDPLDALVCGLGTAFPTWHGGPRLMAFVGQRGPVDFMVTTTFVDPLGREKEWAALILGVGPTLPPVPPSSLGATVQGLTAPVELDDPFSPVVSLSWDAPPSLLPFHLGSYATARRGLSPAAPVVSLLQPRPHDVALQPVGGSVNPLTPHRRSASDVGAVIDSAWTPNSYGWSVTAQSVFGLWSRWSDTSANTQEPPAGKVDLAACRLDATASGGVPGVSTALTCDVTWNWSSRSPLRIEIVGRRYSQTWPDDPPPAGGPTTADTFTGTGAGLLARLAFASDGSISVSSGTGLTATVQHLSLDGKTVEPIPLQARGPRRYRVVVRGLPLDFTAAGRWGVALWARGQERRAPQRMGGWNLQPVVVSASDPRPPVVPVVREDVILASVRTPDGLHRADLRWAAIPGAVAYRVYTCSEATFRGMFNLKEPAPSDTLSTRLAQLRAAFRAKPDRRPFTRLGSEQVTGTSLPITLPRGTKDIHLFMVLGVSAGQVESVWPEPADTEAHRKFLAFAAPQVVVPPAPQIEVSLADADPTAFAAAVRVAAPAGAAVRRIDLHRVRIPAAADTLDTMGPPIATISASGGTWTVTPAPSPAPAGSVAAVRGTDPVPGSWKPVYYRAVSWGHDEPSKGQYGGRSHPSVIRSVVVPPATGPTLTGPTVVLPIAGSAQALVSTSTTAPPTPTPLGDHLLEAEVLTIAPDGSAKPLDLVRPPGPGSSTATPGPVAIWPLSQLPQSEPATPSSGLWQGATTPTGTPIHLTLRRSDPGLALRVRLRLTDPLGRIDEKLLDVAPGTAAALTPDITNPVVTPVLGGWLLTFTTGAPNTGPGGPFVLDVTFRPTGSRRRTHVALELARLPWLPRSGNLLTDPGGAAYAIPLMRSRRTGGVTTIGVGFRAAGGAVVQILAPDGTGAAITREIGS